MGKIYDHRSIEKKWQKKWTEEKLYETPDKVAGKENLFSLVEFVYPSGDLHVGHWYAFTVPDIYVRMKRMQGKNVLYPMGFDAFGLPAENAAIKNKADPAKWTQGNIERMRAQLQSMGNAFDWSREVETCDPAYYKWTQWLFLKLYEKGLAYRGQALVNWDPVDKTVLANEQVLQDGTAERSGAKVEKKELTQWFLKITAYADRLIKDLDNLAWPEPIKEAQRNWIGKSEGAEISFELRGKSLEGKEKPNFLLLHGRGGSPEGAFFPWLKKELEARGYAVQVPRLPGGEEPDDEEQVAHVLKHCTLDANTVVLGHSFGGIVALRLIEQNRSINRMVLVGTPFSGNFLDEKKRPSVSQALKKGFDFEKIKASGAHFLFLYDTHDHVVPVADGEVLSQHLGGLLMTAKGEKPHFMHEKEPDILKTCIPMITIFTTRADTLYGGTYLVLAPEHPFLGQVTGGRLQGAVKNKDEVVAYITKAKAKSEIERVALGKEKTGVELKGVTAINPATKEEIPVWVADYVLGHYGTGAVMGVPAHDERDYEFVNTYGIPKAVVIDSNEPLPYMGVGKLLNSGEFTGLTNEEAKQKITEKFGKQVTTYKLRDWLVSRQRYWGCPIPIVYDPEGVPHRVSNEHLPWLLPTDVDFTPTGVAPLARSKELYERTEKIFGKGWKPEVDTMDVFVDSSWYFLRYLDPKNEMEFSNIEKQKAWMPVDRYSGGGEHTTVHVLYSRFFQKALYDMKLVTEPEPYTVRMNRGIILAEDGRKMSKRWGNVVNPDEQVQNVGADAVRTYLAFIGPYNEVGSFPWNTNGLVGVRRFLERVAELAERVTDSDMPGDLNVLLNQTVKKVGDDIEAMKFNTSVSQLMIFTNELQKLPAVPKIAYETLLRLLAPFAPHLAEELWHDLGNTGFVHAQTWPSYDASKLSGDTVTVVVQIAGKTRGTVTVSKDASEEEVFAVARQDAKLSKLIPERPSRTVFVPGKIINLIP